MTSFEGLVDNNEGEMKIRDNDALFSRLFYASSNPMVISSLHEGRLISVNHAFEKLSGYKRRHLIGRRMSDLLLWARPEERDAAVRILAGAGSVQNLQIEMKTGTGETKTALSSVDKVSVDGESCLLSILVDITGRARAESALKQSEEKYRTLVEHSLQGFAIIQDSRFVFCNKALSEMTGYSAEELLSLSPMGMKAMVHPDDRDIVRSHYQDCLAGYSVSPRYEYRCIAKDGRELWVEVLSSLIELNGRPAVQYAYIDITERKKAEANARETGERLKLALEAAGMNSWEMDMQTGVVKDDEGWLESLGYEKGEITPDIHNWNSLVHPDDLPLIERAAADHVEGKTPIYEVEHRLRNKSGGWIWVLERGKLISRDASGKPLRTVGVHFNITDHKVAIEQIRQLANEQNTILNTITVGICYIEHGRIQWVNPAFLQMFGYEIEDVRGRETAPLYANRAEYEQLTTTAYAELANGSVYSMEALMVKREGSTFWCSIAGRAINPADAQNGSIWVFQDITARRQAEAAIRENEERYRRLLQNSNDIVAIIDESGAPAYVSSSVEKILGYTPEEFLGMRNLSHIHPDDFPQAQEMLVEILEKPGEIRRLELRLRHREGHWVPVEAVGVNMLHDPLVHGIVLNVRDVSERNRLQEQLQQAMKMEAVGVLAGGVAHDFNNLLSVINGYAELLLEDFDQSDPRRGDLEQMAKAGQRAASLTSQLLAFSRKQMIQPEYLDLKAVIEDMSTMLRRLMGENIQLDVVMQPDLGAIYADPGQIQQIIMNLAVNARDAMPAGGIFRIETANLDLDGRFIRDHPAIPGGRYVMLLIQDNGVGMSAATRSHLFEPFFTTKEKGKGTGLGLSTVYGIVKQNNGFIWVESELGQGATIKIYFPGASAPATSSVRETRAEPDPGGCETILLAEDEESVRSLAGRVLREHGYKVLEACDGMDALRVATEYTGNIDLVVTDVVMPRMNGSTMAAQLKLLRPGIKSLFVSGYTDSALLRDGALDQNIDFLQKPFSIDGLTRKVREVLQREK